MHRISITALLLFYFVFASDMEVMDRLEIYVNQEMEKKGEKFKQEVDRCFQIVNRFEGSKDLDNILKKEGCDTVLQEYENVIQKATERYSEEIDKKFEEIKKEYEKKLKKATHRKRKLEVFLYRIQDLKIALLKLPVNPRFYEIYEVKLTDKGIPAPYCVTQKNIWLFLPVGKSNLKYTIYYGEKGLSNAFKNLNLKSDASEILPDNIYTVSGEIKGDSFKQIKLTLTRENSRYVADINMPALYKAYASYDFIGIKKPFPSYTSDELSCVKPSITLEEKPDGIYVVFIVRKGNVVGEKDFMVYGE